MAKKKGAETPEEIQKRIEALASKYKTMQEYLDSQKTIWDSIGTSLFNINKSDFFATVKRSAEQTADIALNLKEAEISAMAAGVAIGQSFNTILEKSTKQIQNIVPKLSDDISKLAQTNALMADSLRTGLINKDLTNFFQTFGVEGMKAFQDIINDKKGYADIKKWLESEAVKHWERQVDSVTHLKLSLEEISEELFSIRKSFVSIGEYITRDFLPKSIFSKLYDFDQILNDTQKNFGLAMDKNSAKFTELIGQNQIYGMGAKENAEFMGSLGENLRTTNFDLLSNAAKDMGAISQATGLSVEETQNLGNSLMLYGKTSKQVASFTEKTMQQAQKYGLNSKKVLQDVVKALPSARALGWVGGAKALADMTIQAQKLGQNMDDLIVASKKLRTLEGAIESSADLALVGVNTNAIQMLGAARRGGKEFSSFIAEITKGFGQIKKDGSVEFDPIDTDRLQVVADSVGISIEKLQDQIGVAAKRNAKISLLPNSMFGSLSKEQQEFILNASEIGEKGEIKFTGDLKGITNVKQLSGDLLTNIMANQKTMKEQAEQNTSFQDSLKNLKASIYNIFTILQPTIESITNFVIGLNKWIKSLDESGKKIAAGMLVAGAVFFSVAKNYLSGYWMGQGFNTAVNKGGFLSGFGKLMNKFNPGNWFKKAETVNPPNLGGGMGNPGKNSKELSSLSQAFKSMPSPAQLLSLATAIAAVGVAFVGIGYGIKLASEGLTSLVKSFDGISNSGEALGAVAITMGSFVGMLALMIPIIGALGTASTAGALGLLALGVAFVGMGFGIKLASDGLTNLVQSFVGLKDGSSAMWSIVAVMGSFVAVSYMMIPALGGLGIALATVGGLGLMAVPVFLSLGLAAIGLGYGMKLAGEGVASVVKSFSEFTSSILKSVNTTPQILLMSGALLTLAPSLLAFGTAGLVATPGIIMLSVALGILTPILSTLTPSLQKLSTINSGSLNDIGKSLKNVSTGLLSLIGVGALFPLLALASASMVLLTPTLSNLSIAIDQLSKVDTTMLKTVSNSLKDIIPSLLLFSTLGIVAPLLLVASVSLGTLGKSLTYFSGLNIANLSNIIQGVSDSAGSLIKFSSIGLFSPAIMLGSAALGVLGKALNNFSGLDILPALNGLKSLSHIVPSLISFASIGVFSAPILLGAGVLALLGGAIPKFVDSMSNLGNIKTDGIEKLNNALLKFIPGLLGLSTIGILAMPIFVGATLLASAGVLLGEAGNGFMKFANLNWNGFKNIKTNMNEVLVSLLKLSAISLIAPAIFVGATLLSGAGLMLGVAASGFNIFSKINFEGLTKFTSIIPEFINGLAKLSVISLIAAPVMIGSSMLAIAGTSLLVASKGFQAITGIDFGKISGLSKGMDEIFSNILKLSTIGLSSPLILSAGVAIGSIGIGLNTLSKSDTSNIKGLSDILKDLIPGLTKFSIIGLLSAPLILASSSLGILGPALALLSNGISKATSIDWSILKTMSDGLMLAIPSLLKFSTIGILSSPIILGALAISLMGKSLLSASSGFQAMANVDWSNVNKMGSSLNNLLPSLVEFGLKGFVAAPGIWLMNSTIGSLANTMERLANPLDIANESLGSMANNIQLLKSSIQGLDSSKLTALADASNRFVSSTVNVSSQTQSNTEPNKSQNVHITFDPVDLKINGRDLQQLILKDTQHTS